jgi:hypothetical protein
LNENYFKIKINTTKYSDLNTYSVQKADGFIDTNENTTEVASNGANELLISGNPFCDSIGVVSTLSLAFYNYYEFTPTTGQLIIEWQGDPSLETGDYVTVESVDGTETYNCILLSNNYKFDGGLRCVSRFKIYTIT